MKAILVLAALLWAGGARAAEPLCDGTPSSTRLVIVVDGVRSDRGLMAVTVYPDDRRRFLQHHGQLAVVRRPSATPSTSACLWLPGPAKYAVAVYQDLNSDHQLNRNPLGIPTEPYGLSNDPPNLFGVPTFGSVRFAVHAGDNTLHIPLHPAPGR